MAAIKWTFRKSRAYFCAYHYVNHYQVRLLLSIQIVSRKYVLGFWDEYKNHPNIMYMKVSNVYGDEFVIMWMLSSID